MTSAEPPKNAGKPLLEVDKLTLRFRGLTAVNAVDLGVQEEEAAELVLDVRRRDEQRLEMQMAGGLAAGLSLMRGNVATTQPAPLVVPRKEAKALNEEAADAIGEKASQ